MNDSKIVTRDLPIIIAGLVLFIFSYGHLTTVIAPWAYPFFFLVFLHGGRSVLRPVILFLAMALLLYFMLYGIIPPFLALLSIGLTLYYAVLIFIPLLADLWLRPRLGDPWSALVFPVVYTLVDFIAAWFLGSWNSIAYSQAGCLPLLQLSSLTGMWGITFLVTAVPSFAFLAIQRWQEGKKVVYAVSVPLVVLFIVFMGELRLQVPLGDKTDDLKIVLFGDAQARADYGEALKQYGVDSLFDLVHVSPQAADQVSGLLQAELLKQTEEYAAGGVDMVVWPEGVMAISQEAENAFLNRCAELAEQEGIYLIPAYFVFPAGFPEEKGRNKLVLITRAGEVAWHFDKVHPVPGARHIAGKPELPVTTIKGYKTSTTICYDMDFPSFISQAGRAGVDVVLAPSWDWQAITPLHAEMARLRAVENGFWLVRPTGQGTSLVCDPYGRTVARMNYFTDSSKVLTATVSGRGTTTAYGLLGDWFIWVSALLFFWLIMKAFFIGRGAKDRD